MKNCSNCGAEMKEDEIICPECGKEKENTEYKPVTAKDVFDVTKGFGRTIMGNISAHVKTTATKAKTAADKAKEAGKNAGKSVAVNLNTQTTKVVEKSKSVIGEAKTKSTDLINKTLQNPVFPDSIVNPEEVTVNKNELLSWLKKDSMRRCFYTEEAISLSPDEFVFKVQQKISDNHIPAIIGKRNVEWDHSGDSREIYGIEPIIDEKNPLSCLLQYDQVGKYIFVENKTFITPPSLPEVPEKRWEISMKLKIQACCMIIGILMLLAGASLCVYDSSFIFPGILCMMISIGLFIPGFIAVRKIKYITDHNNICRLQEKVWEKSWSDWKNVILLRSFQEDMNGQLSNIFDSVSLCIDQVCDELFPQSKMETKKETAGLNILENLVSCRKGEY